MFKTVAFGCCLGLVLGGCGSNPVVKSSPTMNHTSGGLELGVYYLPKKLIRIHLRFDEKGAIKGESGEGAAVPISEITVHGRPIRLVHTTGNDYTDKLKIETEGGFLKKVTNTSEDQRPATIIAIGTDIPNIIPAKPGATVRSAGTSARANKEIDVLIDPLSETTSSPFVLTPEQFNAQYRIYHIAFDSIPLDSGGQLGQSIGSSNNGVIFPITTHYRFETKIYADGEDQSDALFVLDTLIPSTSQFMRLDVSRTAWTRHKTTIDFDKGIFTTADVERDSVTAAVAMLPINVLKAIFSIPTELVQLKINHLSGAKDTIQAQKDLIDAQKELLAAQAELAEKQKKKKASETSDVPDDN